MPLPASLLLLLLLLSSVPMCATSAVAESAGASGGPPAAAVASSTQPRLHSTAAVARHFDTVSKVSNVQYVKRPTDLVADGGAERGIRKRMVEDEPAQSCARFGRHAGPRAQRGIAQRADSLKRHKLAGSLRFLKFAEMRQQTEKTAIL